MQICDLSHPRSSASFCFITDDYDCSHQYGQAPMEIHFRNPFSSGMQVHPDGNAVKMR